MKQRIWCVGFGYIEGQCKKHTSKHDKVGHENPYYCEKCDENRMLHIDEQMNEITKTLASK